MPNKLKSKIRETLVLSMDIETALTRLKQEFGASWRIESIQRNSDTIDFNATRAGLEVSGRIARWQGTESRLQLDGEVLSKIPYETWREWTWMSSFVALFAIYELAAYLPLTATTFQQLFYLSTTNSAYQLFLLFYFLVIPFLTHHYFTQLSPDIQAYGAALRTLADFVSDLKKLQTLPDLDTSRLEDQNADLSLAENLSASPSQKQMG